MVLYNQFMGEVSNDNYFAAALCVIIVAITMVFFFLQRYIARKHSYSMSALKPMQPPRPAAAAAVSCATSFVYLVVFVALLPQTDGDRHLLPRQESTARHLYQRVYAR